MKARLQRARAQGKRLGRRPCDITDEQLKAVAHYRCTTPKVLGVSQSVVHRGGVGDARRRNEQLLEWDRAQHPSHRHDSVDINEGLIHVAAAV